MKKILTLALLLLTCALHSANGDTTTVRSHNATHWSWYGQVDSWAVFPDTTHDFRKITLKYKLGCPSFGCSDWDYTTQIFVLRHTGVMDSTFSQSPHFTVDGNAVDSVAFSVNPVYVYYFDTAASAMDSMLASTVLISIYGDSLNPQTQTNILQVYPAGFYNYLFDSTGSVVDSAWVAGDSTYYNGQYDIWTKFEVIDPIEIARYITPYGNNLTGTWNNTWEFDITDYAPLLHDSVEIRAFYSGWSDGFTITLDYEMIEGTPPRTPKRVTNLWSGYFPYGDVNNPIENYLVPRMEYIAPGEVNSEVRIDITGHGFNGNENCAEFCPKMYYLNLDGIVQYQKLVWRENCGMNSLYPQPGTWLYDRSNWCPGDRVYPFSHELTPYATPGDSILIDMNMEAFVNVNNSNPGYQVDGQLITYGAPNFSLDAEMRSIIAPSSDPNMKRFNPVCNRPVVIIRNDGSTTLTSLTITYGVIGAPATTFSWTGSLAFLETDTVFLPTTYWFGTAAEFFATVSNPNGQADQYADNNTLQVAYVAPPEFVGDLVFECKTNNNGWEASYQLTDADGNVLFSRSNLANNTVYRDTIHVVSGCFQFRLQDAGKDGLSWWANNAGAGYMRIKKLNNQFVKIFNADFGTEIYQEFTVGYNVGQEEVTEAAVLEAYPNPTTGKLTIDFQASEPQAQILVFDATGRIISDQTVAAVAGNLSVDISGNSPGLYFVQLRSAEGVITKRIVLQ
jgi:hypothetical protein